LYPFTAKALQNTPITMLMDKNIFQFLPLSGMTGPCVAINNDIMATKTIHPTIKARHNICEALRFCLAVAGSFVGMAIS
ncbi:MAG TPA: hypothetical protein VMZ03_11070, partial [Chitinophagaceae bacterium]|nr:hypothetical protein [Chitinophagaceae bacterium]